MIEISNNGSDILNTNYWGTEPADKGFLFLSWNDGVGRLLVPRSQEHAIDDMKTGLYVIISSGLWDGREALELVFEDNTSSPYSVTLVTDQTDRLLPDTDQGGGFKVAVWTERGNQLTLDGKFRKVGNLPCLAPWAEH